MKVYKIERGDDRIMNVGRMIIEVEHLVTTAITIESRGGTLNRRIAQEMWGHACNLFQKIIIETDAYSDDGDSARKGAVMSALKAGNLELAENILARLSLKGNIKPRLQVELLMMVEACR